MMIMEGISFWSILNGISLGILLAVIVQAIVSFRTIKKKLHVTYKDPLEGQTIMKVIATLMPQKIIKSMAPKKRPLDVFEVLQEDPYEIKEVEDDKVWLISYKYGGNNPNDAKAWGMGDDQAAYEKVIAAARLGGNEEVMQAQQDWKLWTELFKIDPKEGEKGEYCRRQQAVLHMVVVKLKSGDLLLYCPVQIHEGTKLDTFLKDLGHVKYIVIGSCCHTNHLRSTTMRYPRANIIGTKTAEIKLLEVSALTRKKLDFDLLNESQARQINEVLEPEGVIAYFTKGDLMTHSVSLLAHNTGCEVDLLYAHHDACTCGYRHAWCNSNKNSNPEDFGRRLFRYLLITKPASPFGYLPVYRFAGMDPTSTFSLTNWPRPAPDGSSCEKLASSLRQLLKLDFKQVASVHSSLQSADDFKRSIDADWNWLDGRSLLDK